MNDCLNGGGCEADDRTERVEYMEKIYSECRDAADRFEQALREFYAVQNKAAELSVYRSSGRMMSDRKDREDGLIPKDKGENVLSEYGISGLLTDNHELIAEMLEKAAGMVRITP